MVHFNFKIAGGQYILPGFYCSDAYQRVVSVGLC